MTLDLVQVAEQMPALIARLTGEGERRRERSRAALRLLTDVAGRPEAVEARVRAAQTKWPLALPMGEALDRGYAAPPAPGAYTALATDGSHIDVDRHAPVDCFVLNLGWAAIRYGRPSSAALAAEAQLEPTGSALDVAGDRDASDDHAIRGETLSLLRTVRELARLAELAAGERAEGPLLALLDGNLGLWNVEQAGLPEVMRRRLIYERGGMLPALDALRALAEERPVAFGAYTSRAGTADVVHTLRVIDCPLEGAVACARCPGLGTPERPCDRVGVRRDADLFGALLEPGERSALFRARSLTFLKAGAEPAHWYEQAGHDVAFFYLRLAGEVARVELPVWVAERPERVGLLHALLLDQCGRGPGYPVALQEAHEAAVISGADRRSFAALLEDELARHGLPGEGSAKRWSKQTRGI